jgi:UDP-N-acetylmuramate--alanine ligase
MINDQRPITNDQSLSSTKARISGDGQTAHLIGICGSGMQALAEMLQGLSWTVSGSDLQPSLPTLELLRRRGMRVHRGHSEEFVPPLADIVVYSPAITPLNPERQRAEQLGIPQFSYNQMLGELMKTRIGISIAGTHGKSTTTAMVACLLRDGGFSPSAVIGAELIGPVTNPKLQRGRALQETRDLPKSQSFGAPGLAHASDYLFQTAVSGWSGTSDLFVVESCEYQKNFLTLCPTHAVLTGIEADHFDYFHDLRETREAFAEFVSRLPSAGHLVVRGDCEATRVAAASSLAQIETYSLRESSDWWAADLRPAESGTRFRIVHGGKSFTEVSLRIPGRHNVLNALAAAAICHNLGATADAVRQGLETFRGIRRRFEVLGSWRGVTLIDDYAHHPTAVVATLRTAREQFPGRRLLCAFQPHQESRTRALLGEFAESFDAADEVFLAPIFTAREKCSAAAERTNAELAERLAARGRPVHLLPSLDRLIADLDDAARPGDVLVTMGAGDINRIQHELTRRIQRHHATR